VSSNIRYTKSRQILPIINLVTCTRTLIIIPIIRVIGSEILGTYASPEGINIRFRYVYQRLITARGIPITIIVNMHINLRKIRHKSVVDDDRAAGREDEEEEEDTTAATDFSCLIHKQCVKLHRYM